MPPRQAPYRSKAHANLAPAACSRQRRRPGPGHAICCCGGGPEAPSKWQQAMGPRRIAYPSRDTWSQWQAKGRRGFRAFCNRSAGRLPAARRHRSRSGACRFAAWMALPAAVHSRRNQASDAAARVVVPPPRRAEVPPLGQAPTRQRLGKSHGERAERYGWRMSRGCSAQSSTLPSVPSRRRPSQWRPGARAAGSMRAAKPTCGWCGSVLIFQ